MSHSSNACGVETAWPMYRHSHREPAAHVKVVEDLQAACLRLQILSLQRKGVERPCRSICSLQEVRRDKHQSNFVHCKSVRQTSAQSGPLDWHDVPSHDVSIDEASMGGNARVSPVEGVLRASRVQGQGFLAITFAAWRRAGNALRKVLPTAGMSSLRMDLLTSRRFSWSKKVAFRKLLCPKGNFAGMVFEYETSALQCKIYLKRPLQHVSRDRTCRLTSKGCWM